MKTLYADTTETLEDKLQKLIERNRTLSMLIQRGEEAKKERDLNSKEMLKLMGELMEVYDDYLYR